MNAETRRRFLQTTAVTTAAATCLPKSLHASSSSDVRQNFQNWVDGIKNGGVPHANREIAHRTATAAHLANIAVRVGHTIRFDPVEERIVNDDAANSFLTRKYRQGGHWGIPNGV